MKTHALSAICLCVAIGTGTALATTFVDRPFPDLIKETPTVVHGTIGMSYSDWQLGPDGARRLYTVYELQVDEVFKGDASGKSLSIREMGGEKDGIGMQVPGAAHFNRGEEVVVLLSPKNGQGSFDMMNLSMGKFNLTDQEGKKCLQGGAFDGDEVMHPGGSESEGQAGSPVKKKWCLDDLRQLVHDQGDAPGPNQKGKAVQKVSHVSPAPGPSQNAAQQAAPQLQPLVGEETATSEGHFNLWVLALLGAVAIIAALLLLKRHL